MENRKTKSDKKFDSKQIAVSIVAAILLAMLYLVIFSFSEQDGETSGSISQKISLKCVEFFNAVSGKRWTENAMQDMALYFEHPIRKLAHFGEYTCMGMLVWLTTRPWLQGKKKWYFFIVLWVFLSATADEFHQLFVPDRCGSAADVLLDTGGGAFGALLMMMWNRMLKVRKKHKRDGDTAKPEKN